MFLTYPLNLFAHEHPIHVVEQDFWIPIGYPGDIARAEQRLMQYEAGVQMEVPQV
jgi:NDP-sugar pyrophosphorylase family protein